MEAIKEGAFDFIAKPVDPDYLLLMIDKALAATHIARENLVLREVLQSQMGRTVIIGSSRELLHEAEKMRQVAQTAATVLLRGESGTGKELFARAIHALSPRRDRPFITINSASIPDNLLENELFGHEKGSYTGAHMRQVGKLELAQGGTFFFDEIGDFPLHLQGKILRVLEEKTITRLGSGKDIRAGHPLRLRHQPGPGEGRRREALPPGPLFPHHQLSHRAAAAARPQRRHPAAGRPLRAQALAGDPQARIQPVGAGARETAGLRLAGQRPRAAEHHRAGGDHRRRPRHPAPKRSSCPGAPFAVPDSS